MFLFYAQDKIVLRYRSCLGSWNACVRQSKIATHLVNLYPGSPFGPLKHVLVFTKDTEFLSSKIGVALIFIVGSYRPGVWVGRECMNPQLGPMVFQYRPVGVFGWCFFFWNT